MKADYLITIYEDLDEYWRILSEASIKAKSVKGRIVKIRFLVKIELSIHTATFVSNSFFLGYKCRNYKRVGNKFFPGTGKPEVLEDWDPRYLFKRKEISFIFTRTALIDI